MAGPAVAYRAPIVTYHGPAVVTYHGPAVVTYHDPAARYEYRDATVYHDHGQ